MVRARLGWAFLVVVAFACSACAGASGEPRPVERVVATPAKTAQPASVATAKPAAVASPRTSSPRAVTEQVYVPFGRVGSVTLVHPSRWVERVAFHQSNHEGARQLSPLRTAVRPTILEGRKRLTGARTAADVVIHPSHQVRAPVTGVVKRAGTYVLYCEHSDDFAVIAPDANPAWEVKILHIDGVRVRPGHRVVAGKTIVAGRPTRLPFESQVDELSKLEAWPHVHIEVVDPAIPNKPSPGSGC